MAERYVDPLRALDGPYLRPPGYEPGPRVTAIKAEKLPKH